MYLQLSIGTYLKKHQQIIGLDKKEENFLENLFSDKANFRKRLYDFWNFTISQEKRIIKIYKKLVEFDSMPAETKRDLKPVGTTPGIMYDTYQVHKKCDDGCPLFRPILSVLQIPKHKLANFLFLIQRH